MNPYVTPAAAAKNEPEEELWASAPAVRAHVGLFALAALATLSMAVALFYAPSFRVFLATIAVMVLGSGLAWTASLLDRWSNGYRLTSQRLFTRRGLLSRTTDQLELVRVDDVRVRQSLTQRLVGVADVIVISSDSTDAECVLRSIFDAADVAELIRRHAGALRRQSVFVENI